MKRKDLLRKCRGFLKKYEEAEGTCEHCGNDCAKYEKFCECCGKENVDFDEKTHLKVWGMPFSEKTKDCQNGHREQLKANQMCPIFGHYYCPYCGEKNL